MVDETDGIEEAIAGQVRVAVTAAAQVGQTIATARENALRRAQAASEQEARELRSRLDAERQAARAEVAVVDRAEWWDHSTPEQIGRTYQVARAWQSEDSDIARAEQRMSVELRDRYGIDTRDTGANPDEVRQLIRERADRGADPRSDLDRRIAEAEESRRRIDESFINEPRRSQARHDQLSAVGQAVDAQLRDLRAERDRAAADAERTRSAAEKAEALSLLALADQEDQRADEARAAAELEPDPNERERAQAEAEQRAATADSARADGKDLYDSTERRASMAAALEQRGFGSETVATRMRADVSQAKPATAAVGASKTKAAKARKTRGRGAQVQGVSLDR